MFWHRALLSRFVSAALICLTAIVGDYLVSANSTNRLHKALCDNLTHGAIGALTWASVVYFADLPRWQAFDIVLCTILAMAVDLDHFAAARSFRIEDASNLSHRPLLHCSTIPTVLFACGILVAETTRSSSVGRFSCVFCAALFSHHFRDAARRGLWFWPFGSTPQFPLWLYFSSIAVLPHVLAVIVTETEGRQKKIRTGYHTVQSV